MSHGHPIRDLLRLWFSLSRPVHPRTYAATGVGLMGFKYVTDAMVMYFATGALWTPADYLSPLLSNRSAALSGELQWVLVGMLIWTLPFAWIGASMTARRGLDAGFSGAAGLLFFVPLVNYIWMLALCLFPSAPRESDTPDAAEGGRKLGLVFQAALPAAVMGIGGCLVSIFVTELYGNVLFVGVPFAMGFAASYRARRLGVGRRWSAILAGQLSLIFVGGLFLLFALEGVLCLAMAAPLVAVLALLGSLIGSSAAVRPGGNLAQALIVFCAVPVLLGAESLQSEAPVYEVVSEIEIDAPPEVVWNNVIGFSELPPPSRVQFGLGIAYPMRARIEGQGVGAVRYCEFSTGPFVEPITRWEEPTRLSFDVEDQPEPMHEWSPYQKVNAPHLLDGLRSRRGEFRLIELPGGRTRLEGSTWYTLEMSPAFYWTLWSDRLIHGIHVRVLEHVKHLSERDLQERAFTLSPAPAG